MSIKTIKRVFKYNDLELEDVGGSPENVLNHYSMTIPELINARVKSPEIKDDKAVYEFETKVATKG